MSESGTDTPPFSNVDIAAQEDDELFVSAVQENSQSLNLENGEEDADNSINKRVAEDPALDTLASPVLEEITTERSNNIVVSVTEPQKVGEGMSSYVAYRVVTRTNMPVFSRQQLSVLRRFSDFLGLHEKLTDKYLRAGRIVPPAPEKSIVGTTKVKMTSTPSMEGGGVSGGAGGGQAEFLERRRAALERYLQRTAQHPVLCIDPDFREFLESESELPKATSTSALSGAGVLRLFNKVGETVNKITYKMDETDPWFEEQAGRVECLETCLRRLGGACETLAGERRELGARSHELSRAAAALSGAESHATLSRALASLADLYEKIEGLRVEQSNTDWFVLCEHVKDYIGLIGAIKDVFHERVKVFQNWQHAQAQLNKRRENRAKAELNNRQDKIEQASAEIIEWEAKVDRSRQEFDQISRVIRKELERFDEERATELRATVAAYLEQRMRQAAQAVRIWEAFLPEAKAIK